MTGVSYDSDDHRDSWETARLGVHQVPAGDGTLLVVRRGARVVPFDHLGRPLLWLAPAVRPGADVGAWAASEAWNLGAERLWIGPELRLMVQDRNDFGGTYSLSAAMDPGAWEVATSDSDGLTLRTSMKLAAHQPAGTLGLDIEQVIAPAQDPARRWEEAGQLRHLGWSRTVSTARSDEDDGSVACQAWVLAQVEAPATVLVPGAADVGVTDYFEPIDEAHIERRPYGLALQVTGRRRYKVGIRTGEHRGIIASLSERAGGEAALVVRYFHDVPSSRYLEEPPGAPGHEGDSLYVYNDDGRFGSFGEIEALGRALEPGDASVRDDFELHVWWGERQAVRALASRLLRMGVK